jgi:hypothetical protein
MAAPLDNATMMDNQPVAPTNTPVEAELPAPLPDIIAGTVPGILVPPVSETTMGEPVVEAVVQNFGRLPELGLEVFELPDMSTIVYNPDVLTEDAILEAQANGTIEQLVTSAVAQAAENAAPAQAAAPQTAPLAQATLTGPPPVNESRLTTARIQNFAPRQVSPIEPKPVINAVSKRAI